MTPYDRNRKFDLVTSDDIDFRNADRGLERCLYLSQTQIMSIRGLISRLLTTFRERNWKAFGVDAMEKKYVLDLTCDVTDEPEETLSTWCDSKIRFQIKI